MTMNKTKQQTQSFYLVLLAVALAWVAYTIPWVVNPGVSLSLSASDLAEWASLHPEVRAASPALLTSLLLRLPMVFLMFLTAFSVPTTSRLNSREWVLGLVAIGVLLLLTFPPLEIFFSASGDKNYQQQMMLVVVGIVGSVIGLARIRPSFHPYVVMICAGAGIGVSLWGLQQAHKLMADFDLPVRVGLGGIGFSIILAAILVGIWLKNIKQGSILKQVTAL